MFERFSSLATRWQAFTHAAAQRTEKPSRSAAAIKPRVKCAKRRPNPTVFLHCKNTVVSPIGYFILTNMKKNSRKLQKASQPLKRHQLNFKVVHVLVLAKCNIFRFVLHRKSIPMEKSNWKTKILNDWVSCMLMSVE